MKPKIDEREDERLRSRVEKRETMSIYRSKTLIEDTKFIQTI